MPHYKRDDVIGINDNEYFHVECYDGNHNDLTLHQILTKNNIDEEDWYFCLKCEKKI